jgi:hypothetical protein
MHHRDPLGQVLVLDELHHERAHAARFFQAVDVRDIGMIEGRERPASRVNRAKRSGSLAKASGSTFSATSRLSFVSCARYACPMPPSPIWAVTS